MSYSEMKKIQQANPELYEIYKGIYPSVALHEEINSLFSKHVLVATIELSIDDTDAHNNVLYGHATNFMKVSIILHPTSAIGSY